MSPISPRKLFPLPTMLALIVGMFAGCIFVHDDYDSDYGPGAQRSCTDDYDCKSGQYCMRGKCEDLSASQTCRSASECIYGDTCVNGVCNQSCKRDSDCAKGTKGSTCDGFYCRAPSSSDGGTKPPDGGTKPTDGGTAPTDGGTKPTDGGTAPTDGGTNGGGGCPRPPTDGGTSTPPDAGSNACVRNADCPSGNYCINNACVRGCSVETDCAATETCSAGLCRPRPSTTCSNASQCATGSDCVDGTCRVPCTSTTACASGSVCRVGYCQPSSTPGSGGRCTVNCDCPSGERCVEGACQL